MEVQDLEAGAHPVNETDNLVCTEGNEHEAPQQRRPSNRSFRNLLHRATRRVAQRVARPFRNVARTESSDVNNQTELAPIESGEESAVVGAHESTHPTRLEAGRNSTEPVESTPLGDESPEVHEPQNPVQQLEETTPENSGYKRMVKTMTEDEVKAENERRKEIRGLWRQGEDPDLEDPWKTLWKEQPNYGRGLFEWPCDDEKRKSLQVELIDALSSAPFDRDFPRRGIRSISCWISLIGLRLNDLYLEYDMPDLERQENETDSAVTQAEILIECIWACNKSRRATIGDVLEACYQRQVLQQPRFDDSSKARYWEAVLCYHIRAVRISIFLVNIMYKHDFPKLDKSEDLNSAWSMLISTAEFKMRPKPPHVEIDAGKHPFLAVGDLNIKDLDAIGQLRIQWTPYWDEHLKLETTWTKNILKLYWFNPSLSRYLHDKSVSSMSHNSRFRDVLTQMITFSGLCEKSGDHKWLDRTTEIRSTMSLLLSSSSKSADARLQYEELEAPRWLSLLAHYKLGTFAPEEENNGFQPSPTEYPLSRFRGKDEKVGDFDEFCWETKDQMLEVKQWPSGRKLPHERITISQFPYYHEQLRELRLYMDSQQPKGLLELWRDKRNSNSFWTSWFVVFFDFASVGLAFGALVAGIVGTWAQVKSLDQ
ncbi:MAG: hypothetical protein Q9201_004690 [Fulgogasparrea decipioides]